MKVNIHAQFLTIYFFCKNEWAWEVKKYWETDKHIARFGLYGICWQIHKKKKKHSHPYPLNKKSKPLQMCGCVLTQRKDTFTPGALWASQKMKAVSEYILIRTIWCWHDPHPSSLNPYHLRRLRKFDVYILWCSMPFPCILFSQYKIKSVYTATAFPTATQVAQKCWMGIFSMRVV